MSDGPLYSLFGVAALTGVFHTLIPDHWLPFVLIGRVRGWSAGWTALLSGLAALIHVSLSLILGVAALAIGATVAGAVGETMTRASGVLMVLFGAGYAFWAWRKGGHFHPGGTLLHADDQRPACAGDEGDANPEHLHYHADETIIRSRWSGAGLALIIGANPCVVLLPLLFAAGRAGAISLLQTALAYAIPTAVLMVGLSVLGVVTGRRVRLPGAARHMEALSGLLVALVGTVFLLLD